MTKAIITKFHSHTDTKPAKISAKAEGLPKVDFTTDRNSAENHSEAAKKLSKCYGWEGKLAGGFIDSRTYAFVFVDGSQEIKM